jgi:hypothetical protein
MANGYASKDPSNENCALSAEQEAEQEGKQERV